MSKMNDTEKNNKFNPKDKLSVYREEIKELERNSKKFEVLNTLYKLNKKNLNKKNDNLIKIISDPDVLSTAYENLKSNTGIMSKGANTKDTPDGWNYERLKKLSDNIRNGKFVWSPIKRILIPKPNNKKLRPLGIPNFTDKLVQESIRIVLNSIYEPLFQEYEINFGFRPKRSANNAIVKIDREKQGMTTVIEGDIKGAYDNVNFDIMMKILQEKISDNKLLKLIKSGFKAGIQLEKRIEIVEKGVPQGSILSPILFNIYMHKFDIATIEITRNILYEKNIREKRKETVTNTKYNRIKYEIKKQKDIISKNKDKTTGLYKDFTKHKLEKKILRRLSTKLRKTKNVDQGRKKLHFSYTRYADDWIIMTNANEETCEKIKIELKSWLQINLKLELSTEKTKITKMKKEAVNFLGFSIFQPQPRIVTFKDKLNRTIKKRINVGPKIGIDINRILNKFKSEKIISKTNKPTDSPKYTILKSWQIIETYNLILRGIFNYYMKNITDKSRLAFIYYLLKYSCYKTLARRKRNSSISKIILTYGRDPHITIQNRRTGDPQFVKFPSYQEIYAWAEEIAAKQLIKERDLRAIQGRTRKVTENQTEIHNITLLEITMDDIMKYKKTEAEPFTQVRNNLRSAYKLQKHCSICMITHSKENPIELHHVNHIKKGKVSGFTGIMKALNRKTIPCCKKCHMKIHKGQYDGIRLRNIMDTDLIVA